jgi:small subunit ribosomal protein S20
VPHHKSQAKSLRSDSKKRLRNRAAKSEMRTMIKKLREAPDAEQAAALLPKTISVIDKAAKRGVIKKGTADRHKSRLCKHVATLSHASS